MSVVNGMEKKYVMALSREAREKVVEKLFVLCYHIILVDII